MKEYLFRGKRLDNNEWIEGYLCESIQEGKYCIMPNAFFATRDFGDEDENKNPIISDSMAIGGFFPVISETIGQWTGIITNHNQKLFVGDIISSFSSGGNETKHIVIWDKEETRFALMHCNYTVFDTPMRLSQLWISDYDKKIIGNIHDKQLKLF